MVIKALLIAGDPGESAQIRALLTGQSLVEVKLTDTDRLDRALELAATQSFDVVLMDLDPPDDRGLGYVTETLALHPDLPIVALADNEALATEAVRAGAQDYLLKGQLDARSLGRVIRYSVERAQAHRELQASEARYHLAVLGARDGVWDWDLKKDRLYLSARWKAMLDYRDEEIGNSPTEWLERVHPEDLKRLRLDIDAHHGGTTPHFENEHRLRMRDGSYCWVLARGVAVRDRDGTPLRMAGSLTDVTERHQTEERLIHETLHDSLTHLPNRTYFMRILNRALTRIGSQSPQFAVLFLDVDRYKVVNDSLGHLVGDQLLVAFAHRLERCLRPGDTVARLGGDEFTIFLDHITDVIETSRIATRILQEVNEAFAIDRHEIYISASIGIVLSSSGYQRAEDMLRDADLAMYQAKAKGKARYEIFDRKMHRAAMARLNLEMDLRRAVDKKSVVVHYQPIVRLVDGKVTGFEALARWKHNGTFTPPRHFIHAAEETGLILPIGEHILRSACQQLRLWRQQGWADEAFTVSVNLSGKQLMQPDLCFRIEDILAENGLGGDSLVLEITESAILEHSETVHENLRRIKDCGITCAMDDFGTGYASLSNLRRLPIDVLKVDRSFISGKGAETAEAAQLVQAIIGLARSLDIAVVAEGVETLGCLKTLVDLQCAYAQGHYFSPAVDSFSAGRILAAGFDWGGAARH